VLVVQVLYGQRDAPKGLMRFVKFFAAQLERLGKSLLLQRPAGRLRLCAVDGQEEQNGPPRP